MNARQIKRQIAKHSRDERKLTRDIDALKKKRGELEVKIEAVTSEMKSHVDDYALIAIDDGDDESYVEALFSASRATDHEKSDEEVEDIRTSVRERIAALRLLPENELSDRIVAIVKSFLMPEWKGKISAVTRELAASESNDSVRHEEIRPTLEKLFTLSSNERRAVLKESEVDAELEALLYGIMREVSRVEYAGLNEVLDNISAVVRVRPLTQKALDIVRHEPSTLGLPPKQIKIESRCNRVYQNPNGYRSYAHPFGIYGRFLDEHSGDGFKRMIAAEKSGLIPLVAAYYVSALALALAGWPLYWIGHDILMAAMASDLPDDLNAEDMRWPRDAMTFMLPTGALREGDGHVEIITIARHTDALESVDASLAERDGVAPFAESYRGLMMIDTYHSKETVGQSTYTLRGPLSGMLSRTSSAAVDQDRQAWGMMGIDLSEVKASTNDVMKTAINLLLIMQARRELLTGGDALHGVKVKRGSVKSHATLWSPLWIGKDYRISREAPGVGTHATPRLHWRKGHWRNQPYGERSLLRRLRWIEPTLAGGKHDS